MAEAAHPGAALFPAPLTGRRPRRALGLWQVPEQVHGGGAVERRLRATLGGGGGGAVTHRGRPCQSRAAQPPPQSATRGGGAGGGMRKRTGAFGLGFWSRDKLLRRFPRKEENSGAERDIQTGFWPERQVCTYPLFPVRPNRQSTF